MVHALSLLTFAAAATTVHADAAHEEAAMWQLGVQGGAGSLHGVASAVVLPRLAMEHSRAGLTLQVPIWQPLEGGGNQANSWSDPDFYGGFVEDAYLRVGEVFTARVGSLNNLSLGHGTVLRNYHNSLDPSRPRGGAQVQVDTDTIRVHAVLDSVMQPKLLGASLELHPVAWLADSFTSRWPVYLDAAVDWQAPLATRRGVVAAATALMGARILEREAVGLELYAGAGMLHREEAGTGVAAHGGLRGEAAPFARALLLAQVEGVWGTRGYRAEYFDMAYDVERIGLAFYDGTPKAAAPFLPGYGLRWRLEGQWGAVRVGGSGLHMQSFERHVGVFTGVATSRARVSIWLWQRYAQEWADLATMSSAFAALDVGVRVYDGWFVSGLAQHSLRPVAGAGSPLTWLMTIGYGVQGRI